VFWAAGAERRGEVDADPQHRWEGAARLGSVSIFGHPVGSSAARADLGWVPQELAVYPLLTCRENLQAFGRYQGLHGKALDDAIAWCLEWAALADRAGSPVRTLSGGMKRRPEHGGRTDSSAAAGVARRADGGR